ncbi:MAG: hypothetical protein Q8K36_05050 [Alphaproteobacteria bacterium]|nr:hypothetical protein [Alphaproteobacteria bacterium]
MLSKWLGVPRDDTKAAKLLAQAEGLANIEDDIPSHFLCPITLNLMKDPVRAQHGHIRKTGY